MSKGQTAFEYLLMLSGSILVAVIVITISQGTFSTSSQQVNGTSGILTQLSEGGGLSCTSCDSVFVQVGQPNSVTAAMLAPGARSTTWTQNGSNQYSALSGNVGIGTSNPTSTLSVNGTASASSITVDTAYINNNANVGTNLTAAQLNAGVGISAPGFTVSSSVTNVNSIYANQLCMKVNATSTSYTCINDWSDLLNVLYVQVG